VLATTVSVAEVTPLAQMAYEVSIDVPGAWPAYDAVVVHDAGSVVAVGTQVPDELLGARPEVTVPLLDTKPAPDVVSSSPPPTSVVPLGHVAVEVTDVWVDIEGIGVLVA